jgi:hypothetical protein
MHNIKMIPILFPGNKFRRGKRSDVFTIISKTDRRPFINED